jgi:hypothetical protein
MPQVWLNYYELAEFLDSSQDAARHAAIAAGWPRQSGTDAVMRFCLPAKEALRYVLLNASVREPRDAVLLENALREVSELKECLRAQGPSDRLASAASDETTTDHLVVELRAAAAQMRRPVSEDAQEARRSFA